MMMNNALYRQLMQNMDEAVSITDNQWVTSYVNPRFCELIGREESDIIGKPATIFLDSASKKKVAQFEKSERLEWLSSSYEVVFISQKKQKITVTLNAAPLPDGGTIGIMTDIRKAQKQEQIYSQLIDHMEEAVAMTDSQDIVTYANPKLCNLLWKNIDEIVGYSANEFLDEASKKKVEKINKNEREKGKSSSYDITIVTKLWNHIPVQLNGTPLPDGGTIGIMTDMRELQAKAENEKILYNAVQYSTDGIIMCNTLWEITFWNKGAQMIFGSKHDDMIGKGLSSIFNKKDLWNILQDNEIITKYDIEGKHRDKSKMRISITQTPILNEKKNKIVSYLLICRDVTNHRKIETEMESKYKKIREVYQGIGIIKRQSDYIFDLLDMFENYHYDLSSIGDFIVTSVIMLTHADGCELRIYDKKHDKLDMISHFWFSQDWSGKKKIHFKGSLAEKAYESGKPLKIIDILQETKYQTPALARKHGMTSLLLIPLIAKWNFIWVLSLYTKADKKLEIFENEFIEKYAKVIQLLLASSV